MSAGLPASVSPGQIYKHDRFYYRDDRWQRKYLLILAISPSQDFIYKLLTSRPHGRPTMPLCSYQFPYPSFYLGHLGTPLSADSWLNLGKQKDYDSTDFSNCMNKGDIQFIATLSIDLFCLALDCVANADDTTRQQEGCIRNVRAQLNCNF